VQLSEDVSRLAKEAKPPLVWFGIGASAVDDIGYTAAATLRSLYAGSGHKTDIFRGLG
jgi:hypothetical protein